LVRKKSYQQERHIAAGWITKAGIIYTNRYPANRSITSGNKITFDINLCIVKGDDNMPLFLAKIFNVLSKERNCIFIKRLSSTSNVAM